MGILRHTSLQKPKLSLAAYYPSQDEKYATFTTPGSTFGFFAIIMIILYLIWRYQITTIKKQIIKQKQKQSLSAQNQIMNIQRSQEETYRDLESYYNYTSMHPQNRLHQVLLQNNPRELESFIDES
tara:strand:+ start:257 stop:634 length:378 start_codon:yes stop_codon:yes gene_type:complete